MKDLNRQRVEMVETVKGRITKAKEMCEEKLMHMGRHGHEHVRSVGRDWGMG
jgi:hypothetical protein